MRYCVHCGKQIADEAVICLSCGCATERSGRQTAAAPTQIVVEDNEPQLATWSKICGIVSFFVGWFALGITAIVLANMSKDDSGGQMCPSAKVGCICGIISTALSGLLVIWFVILLALIA